MKELSIAICDENKDYLQMVQKYLLKREFYNFDVQVFSDIEKLKSESVKKNFDFCLINESFLKNELEEIESGKIWILTENKKTNCIYPHISKYQSMDKILEKLIEELPEESGYTQLSKKTKLLAFFETAKTKDFYMGYNVSKHLTSLGKKVLYLNFSPFTQFNFLTNMEGSDVTDLIYYLLKDTSQLSKKIELMKKEKDGVSLFLPAFDYKDLLELDSDSWRILLEKLERLEDFDVVVLETNAANRGLMEIYDRCVGFFMKNDDEGLSLFLNMLSKKNSAGAEKIKVYDKSDFDYWKELLSDEKI